MAMSEYKQNHHNSEKTDGCVQVDARQNTGRPAAVDSGAHWRTRVPANATAAVRLAEGHPPVNLFTTKTWVRVLSVLLSLLLAFTMFDATALVSYADELPGDEVPATDDGGADDAEEAGRQAALAWASSVQSQDLDPDVLEALLPEGLVEPTEVLPQVTVATEWGDSEEAQQAAEEAAIAARLRPNLVASGAPFSAEAGFYVKGRRVQAAFELGDLGKSLEGGYLAGSKPGDRFVFTLEAPYLYTDDAGAVATTYAEEEWRLRHALADQADRVTAGAEDAAATLDESGAAAAEAALDAEAV